MESYSVEQYQAAGCPMLNGTQGPIAVMCAVHHETSGRICETGCASFNGGKCGAYHRLIRSSLIPLKPAVAGETVKAESLRLNISISEVRRRRNPR